LPGIPAVLARIIPLVWARVNKPSADASPITLTGAALVEMGTFTRRSWRLGGAKHKNAIYPLPRRRLGALAVHTITRQRGPGRALSASATHQPTTGRLKMSRMM
jgi:hypothetical protein